ncbi:hypothetical protein [Nocardioides alcanivorans]|uniref:hypothetical protein n=1 Tax=Nocardioides alcanivorans TaxID=2897352 RepID=UPI001F2C893A|nr:hypothetical protein [Nocardioides alcanivorans]
MSELRTELATLVESLRCEFTGAVGCEETCCINGQLRALLDRHPEPTADCACPPCPGRGNDGHGLTHCAECCFGSGVEADMDCPTHGEPTADRDELARLIRECNTPPDACPWDLLPEGVRDNWRRDADAVINAGWRKS